MKFKIEKVSSMIFITGGHDIVFKAWDESEFTERKLKNAMKRLGDDHNGNATFERLF